MFFKIGALKNFAVFTGKHLCWNLFLMKLQAFRCFPVNIAKFLTTAFFIDHLRWLLLQMFCFTFIFKKTISVYALVIHCIIVSLWNLKSLSFTFICFHSLCHLLSFVVPLVAIRCHPLLLVVIHCQSLSFVVTCYHSLHYPLSLVVTRCHSLCPSLSFVVTRCHSLYHSLPFVVTRCHLLSLIVPLVITRCHMMYHSSVFL